MAQEQRSPTPGGDGDREPREPGREQREMIALFQQEEARRQARRTQQSE